VKWGGNKPVMIAKNTSSRLIAWTILATMILFLVFFELTP
jgi:hypothetical protein